MLGLGTWHVAEDARRRSDELRALRVGLDLGMTLVDTAEMYGDGRAEALVGEAIRGRRDEVFVLSKVLPSNAGAEVTVARVRAASGASGPTASEDPPLGRQQLRR